MRIIKAGKKPNETRIVTCPHCGAELELCRRDIKERSVKDPYPDDLFDYLFSHCVEHYYVCEFCGKECEI